MCYLTKFFTCIKYDIYFYHGLVICFQPSHAQVKYPTASGLLPVIIQLDPVVGIPVILDISRKVEFQPSSVKCQPTGA